jgi:hypothetical protein
VPDTKIKVLDFLKSNSLWDKVSPDEKELYNKDKLTEQEKINISWRTEAVWLLLWTINKVDKIKLPIDQVKVNDIVEHLPDFLGDPKEYIDTSEIRPTSEILDISDLTYRLHWATRNSEFNGKNMPANLNENIVQERHYAINWVTFYADEWDEITTDT